MGARRRTLHSESIMDPRRAPEQSGLFHSKAPASAEIEAIRLAAVRSRDAAIADILQRAARRVGAVFSAVADALTSWPERRATYEKLKRLNDRELADIGLTRGDIARVFEPDFQLPVGRAANGNEAAAQARAKAA
ncbi:DUF1127 domain-containing protein [Falsiroseomonas oryziterrae]|uniref:DUF1127 domain-containing protein n=1 Tax=Falsiroseomonas oryziterrae TaxID=2911368 RepID=UPI001F2F74DC|nr:DUF1127 domain-containing protein [Roseomonas sp. NPKOSM-4]